MFQQEAFNQMLHRSGMNHRGPSMREYIEEMTLLYIAFRMTNLMDQRGIRPLAKLDSTTSIDVVSFGVEAGRLRLHFYEPREDDHHGQMLDFDNGFRPVLHNTWRSPVSDEVTEGTENDKKPPFRDTPMKCFLADRVMDPIDLNIVRAIYEQALAEILGLIGGWQSVGRSSPNPNLVEGSVIYDLRESERVLAACQLVERVKRPAESAQEEATDLKVRNLMTGTWAFVFSGHFGTEQQWLKANSSTRGHRSSINSVGSPSPELGRDEQAFIDYFNEYFEAAKVPDEVYKTRRPFRR